MKDSGKILLRFLHPYKEAPVKMGKPYDDMYYFVEDLVAVKSNTELVANHKFGGFNAAKRLRIVDAEKASFETDYSINNKIDLRISPKALSFYNIKGEKDSKEVYLERRPGRKKKISFIILRDLFTNAPKIILNSHYDIWSKLRITKVMTGGGLLTDVINLKLLESDFLLLHAGCVGYDNSKAALIAALPDVGKTYTTLRFLEDGFHFLSEDLVVLDKVGRAYGIPYTETVDKRKNMSRFGLQSITKKIYEKIFKANFMKKNAIDSGYLKSGGFMPKANVEKLFILDRGEEKIEKISPERAFSILLPLNRLEFSYFRNEIILTYMFFNDDYNIDDFMQKEADLLRAFLDKVPIFLVTAPRYDKYHALIMSHM